MFKRKQHGNPVRVSLLQYWTWRYVITLIVGLLAIGLAAAIWIRETTIHARVQLLELLAQDIAERIQIRQERIVPTPQLARFIDERQRFYGLTAVEMQVRIIDVNGNVLFNRPGPLRRDPSRRSDVPIGPVLPRNGSGEANFAPPPPPPSPPNAVPPSNPRERIDRSERSERLERLERGERGMRFTEPEGMEPPRPEELSDDARFPEHHQTTATITSNDHILGHVIIRPAPRTLEPIMREFHLIILLLVALGLLGWLVIYLLVRKLSRPIQMVAEAALHVKRGKYDIVLPEGAREREIHELIDSFRSMTTRLQQLEQLRTELLAGITHELRTPITSIRGLLFAVRDKVVSEQEAEEFLNISLKETSRLHKMVEELLDFNSFAAGVYNVECTRLQLDKAVNEMVNHWYVGAQQSGDGSFDLLIEPTSEPLYVIADASRIQQILTNLLNNARHAFPGITSTGGTWSPTPRIPSDDTTQERQTITVRIYSTHHEQIAIDIIDTGMGIPASEQPYIFERFYRGDDKKHRVRGLGLGLPFSRGLAQAMQGQLIMRESAPGRTVFSLLLPRA